MKHTYGVRLITTLATLFVLLTVGCSEDAKQTPDARPPDLQAVDASAPDRALSDQRPPDQKKQSDQKKLSDQKAPPQKLKVLFVGNSYTFVNDLPTLVSKLAQAAGAPALTVDSATGGGLRMQNHWANAATLKKIDTGGWTHVVLQGQSMEPVCAYVNFGTYAKKLGDRVKKAGATPVFFMTWARKAGSNDYKQWPCTGGDAKTMQKGLREAYTKAAKATGGVVAPVGDAWEKVLTAAPSTALHSGDGSHPSMLGSYLAACVFYATMGKRKCTGNTFVPAGVGAAAAKTMQKAADDTVKP